MHHASEKNTIYLARRDRPAATAKSLGLILQTLEKREQKFLAMSRRGGASQQSSAVKQHSQLQTIT
ncbi:hypothetical protein BV898_20318, partial [Hypsibius exemplaris]